MTVNYTTLLALGQPVTGTESGTWGDDVNNSVTSYLDIAIAGTLSFTGDGAVTLANTQGTSTVTNIGSTTAQYAVLRFTGTLTLTKVVTAPSTSKIYLVDNATSGGFGVTIKASGQTGYTVSAGTKAWVYYNGTDYVLADTNDITKLTGTLATTNGGTGLTSFTSGGAVYATSTSALTTGTLPIASGGTGQTTASAAFNALSPITTTGDLILGNGANSATRLPIGTNGFVLTSNGTTASWAASTGGVTSFSAGTTGFTPSTATTGAITLAGTLAVANGGTGQTSYTNGQLLIGNTTGNTLTKATLTAGTGISITNGTGSITIAASSTTSIGLVRAIAINCILP